MSCQCSCHRSDDHRPITPDHDAVESTATLMSRIDGKIARTREKLGGLLSQRNLMVAVNRLPTELLSLVFTMTQERWRESDPLRLAVTHVCKQWRAFALNCSALWNYIEIGSSLGFGLVNEMLRRARDLPLLVNIETEPNSTLEAALTLAPRARQLRVYLGQSDHVDAFQRGNGIDISGVGCSISEVGGLPL
jgi:hypothetical protein